MVIRILLALLLTLIFCAPMIAKEFYSFPPVTTVEDRDLYLLRRPAAAGYNNNTGTRNISGASLKSSLFPNMTGYARKGESVNFATVDANAVNLSSWFIADGDITSTNGALIAERISDNLGTWAYTSDLVNHPLNYSNPHQTTPNHIFGTPTSAKYPLFQPGGGFIFTRPLEACVDVFDGAPGTPGATGATGANGANGAAGANGLPGRSAIFCNLSGGTRAVSYSSLGDNPLPIMAAFAVQLWNGASRVVAESWVWWTGGSSARITGSGSGTILPTVKATYSQYSSNNYLAVTVRYSSASTGRQYCTTGTPIAVTRAGLKGDTGEAGSPDTQAQILTKIMTATDGAILTMRQGATEAATVAKVSIKDAAGNTRQYSDGAGYQFFKDTNGYNRVTIDSAGTVTIKDAANKTRLTIDTYGQLTGYRGDGITKSFQRYTTRLVL